MPLPFLLNQVRLELEAQTKLNPARTLNTVGGNELGVDDAEGGWVGHVKRWIKEIDVVEQVEEVGRKFDFDPLRDRGLFPEGHVKVPEAQPLERTVSAVIGVRCKQRLAEIANS